MQSSPDRPIRLARFMALAGVASRRKSEAMIERGLVEVDGHLVTTPAFNVIPGRQEVRVEGRRIELPSRWTYLAVYKPRGYVSTSSDPQGRPTALDLVETGGRRLFIVGRLDLGSEGLLVLTDDGSWAQSLLHPSRGHLRTYRVAVPGRVSPEKRRALLEGVELADGPARAQAVRTESVGRERGLTWLEIELSEGRNRQIRRMLGAVGLEVSRLIRTRMGPIRLGELKPGQWRPLAEGEIQAVERGE